jgi:hypothetical protein
MKYQCPICQNEMVIDEHKIKYVDYVCRFDLDDHLYMHRVCQDKIMQLKIRFTEPDHSRIYVKIYYDQGKSEVWTRSQDNERIKIGHVFDLDFSEIDKLKRKIKTYLLFS